MVGSVSAPPLLPTPHTLAALSHKALCFPSFGLASPGLLLGQKLYFSLSALVDADDIPPSASDVLRRLAQEIRRSGDGFSSAAKQSPQVKAEDKAKGKTSEGKKKAAKVTKRETIGGGSATTAGESRQRGGEGKEGQEDGLRQVAKELKAVRRDLSEMKAQLTHLTELANRAYPNAAAKSNKGCALM